MRLRPTILLAVLLGLTLALGACGGSHTHYSSQYARLYEDPSGIYFAEASDNSGERYWWNLNLSNPRLSNTMNAVGALPKGSWGVGEVPAELIATSRAVRLSITGEPTRLTKLVRTIPKANLSTDNLTAAEAEAKRRLYQRR